MGRNANTGGGSRSASRRYSAGKQGGRRSLGSQGGRSAGDLHEHADAPPSCSDFTRVLEAWIDGQPLVELARRAGIDIDTMLGVHARVISYVLQVAVEQGVGLLKKLLEASDRELAQAPSL